MSVKVSDRNESKLEAVFHATRVRQDIHDLCIRDFGIKDVDMIVRKKIAYRADPKANLEKYVLLMHQCKERLHFLADDLIATTRAANRIKMNTVARCDRRLEYQERALDTCEMLIGKIQDVVDIFWVDLNCYRQYIDSIDHEITLLRGWIQYTNKTRDKLMRGSI